MNYRSNENVIGSLHCPQMNKLPAHSVHSKKILSRNEGYLMMIDPSESDLVDSLTKLKGEYMFKNCGDKGKVKELMIATDNCVEDNIRAVVDENVVSEVEGVEDAILRGGSVVMENGRSGEEEKVVGEGLIVFETVELEKPVINQDDIIPIISTFMEERGNSGPVMDNVDKNESTEQPLISKRPQLPEEHTCERSNTPFNSEYPSDLKLPAAGSQSCSFDITENNTDICSSVNDGLLNADDMTNDAFPMDNICNTILPMASIINATELGDNIVEAIVPVDNNDVEKYKCEGHVAEILELPKIMKNQTELTEIGKNNETVDGSNVTITKKGILYIILYGNFY